MNSKLENKKARLQEESEKFEDALTDEFSEFSEKAADLAGKILIIGGGALLSYLIVKMIVGKGGKEEKSERSGGDGREEKVHRYYPATSAKYLFFRSLSDKAALVLLELAREMIVKYVKDLPLKDEN
jgi:hypothetical protein